MSSFVQLPKAGEKVGSGVIVDIIGSGGSASVFKTWVEDLELFRAVKILAPNSSQETIDRFLTEAKLSVRLHHPNIVQVSNYGTTEGDLPFIEMEHIQGKPVSEFLRSAPLPPSVALALAHSVLEALSYAHNLKYTMLGREHLGLVHRDVKPANVFINADGIPKLVDFGIARPFGVSLHTMPGTVPGTVAYMSPEACNGLETDARSDIYQVGLLLFECLLSRTAFPQTTLTALLSAKVKNALPPLESSGIDPRILPFVTKCLATDPANRYQSADLALSALSNISKVFFHGLKPAAVIQSFLSGVPLKVSPGKNHKNYNLKPILYSVLVFALFSAIAFFLVPLFKQPAQSQSPQPILKAAKDSLQNSAPQPLPKPKAPVKNAQNSPRPAKQSIPQPIQQSKFDTIPPTDALYHLKKGDSLFSVSVFASAYTSYQAALRLPSATVPRKNILRQALYNSAKCNSALLKTGAVSPSVVHASWRAVLNAFGPSEPEYLEASNIAGASQ